MECVLLRTRSISAILFLLLSPAILRAQKTETTTESDHPDSADAAPHLDDGTRSNTQAPAPASAQGTPPSDQESKKDDSEGKQTPRIMWVVPNFAAVSADTQLP